MHLRVVTFNVWNTEGDPRRSKLINGELRRLADLCRQVGLDLHVDAAWAGAVSLSARLRPPLDGIERADSVTIDAHKWLSAPMGAGVFLTPHGEELTRAFRVATNYMPSAELADPYLMSAQWSRRFIGLRVFRLSPPSATTGMRRRSSTTVGSENGCAASSATMAGRSSTPRRLRSSASSRAPTSTKHPVKVSPGSPSKWRCPEPPGSPLPSSPGGRHCARASPAIAPPNQTSTLSATRSPTPLRRRAGRLAPPIPSSPAPPRATTDVSPSAWP
jgi:pyridoxal-dependent decarboxylase-like protein